MYKVTLAFACLFIYLYTLWDVYNAYQYAFGAAIGDRLDYLTVVVLGTVLLTSVTIYLLKLIRGEVYELQCKYAKDGAL
jgi:hypothetical protein